MYTPKKEVEEAMKIDTFEMVNNFQRRFKHPVPESPEWPTEDALRLRYELIREELEEFKIACEESNLVEAGDALGDALFVVVGGFSIFGLANKYGRRIMAEIYVSNMSKAFPSVQEVQEFIDQTADESGPQYEYVENEDGTAICYHAKGEKKGKVCKYPGFTPPDLSFLTEALNDK